VNQLEQKVSITHPFHPLYKKEFELIRYRRSWRTEYVDLVDENNQVIAIPIGWTSAASIDPFVEFSAGRSFFRIEDLVRLVDLINGLQIQPSADVN
jgi:hypothetical protein